jgi:type III secretory pathway lipoprotein EscJ
VRKTGVRAVTRVALLLLLCACVRHAAAEELMPTPAEEQARLVAERAHAVEAHLGRLANVVDASVLLSRPAVDPLAPPGPPVRATASVIVRARGPVAAAEIQRLCAAAVEGLAAEDVAVAIVDAPPAPPQPPQAVATQAWARVGPFRVAASSRMGLLLLLGGACVVIAALAGWIILMERRLAARGVT